MNDSCVEMGRTFGMVVSRAEVRRVPSGSSGRIRGTTVVEGDGGRDDGWILW